jgi:hypothetical protein
MTTPQKARWLCGCYQLDDGGLNPGYACLRRQLAHWKDRAEKAEARATKRDQDFIEKCLEGNASAHVVIESGVIPGVSYPCRCDECRVTAMKMDAAGFLDDVKDAWWHVPAAEAARDGGGKK